MGMDQLEITLNQLLLPIEKLCLSKGSTQNLIFMLGKHICWQ